jgi:hypothetical protein
MYSKAGGYTSNRMRPGAVGYTFFNVPSGKEKEAERLGLQRTKSGKYALAHIYPDKERYASSIEELEQAFGPGKYWEPKNEGKMEENFHAGHLDSEYDDNCDERSMSEQEQLDELSKGTLGSYVKKAGRSAGNIGSKLGQQRATSDEVDRFTNRHMADKYDTGDVLKKQLGASSRDQDDTLDKFGRRTKGIDRAVDRLTRESDEQLSEEAKEMNRMRELAGLNPAVLFSLGDDDYPV